MYKEKRPRGNLFSRILKNYSNASKNRYYFSKLSTTKQYTLLNTAYFDKGKVIFIKNSKAGCTSLLHYLYKLNNGFDYKGKIHTDKLLLEQGFPCAMKNDIRASSDNIFKFSTVRLPHTRLESAFKDFVLLKRNPSLKDHYVSLEKYGCFAKNKKNKYKLSAFIEYVESQMIEVRVECDRHWRTQTDTLALNEIKYDLIGKIEDTTSWVKEIEKRFDHKNCQGLMIKNSSTSDSVLDNTHLSKIYDLYKIDYENFGY